ncbi:MAG: hypothetical protein GX616_01270 [Planctomycetes bacterium]|nr:hypothetical protein [Planctomycetota bacterium]
MPWKHLYKNAKLKAACMGAGLATAWGGGNAEGAFYRVDGWVEPTRAISHVYAGALFWGSSSSWWHFHEVTVGTIDADQRVPFSYVFEDTFDPTWLSGARYGIFAIYDSVNDGVTLGIDNTHAAAAVSGGVTWANYFGTHSSWTESYVAGLIRSGTPQAQESLSYFLWEGGSGYAGYWNGEALGVSSTLVSFSGASSSGLAYASYTEVPEPTTVSVAAPVVAMILLGRGRRR